MWPLPSQCCNARQTGRMWCLRANWTVPANRADGKNLGGTGPMVERTDTQTRPDLVLVNSACVGRPRQKTRCAAFRGSSKVVRGILSSPLMPLRQPSSYQDPAYVRLCRPRSINDMSHRPVARQFERRCGSAANTFGFSTVGGRGVVMVTSWSAYPSHSAFTGFGGFWSAGQGAGACKSGIWCPPLPGQKPGSVGARAERLGSCACRHAVCRQERKQ